LDGRLTVGGNVGIGTPRPEESLQIDTGMVFHNGGHKIIGFGWSPSSNKCLQGNCYPAEIRWDPGNGMLSLGIDATVRATNSPSQIVSLLTISHQGNVGVGTTNPRAKLHVVGGNIVMEAVANNAAAKDLLDILPNNSLIIGGDYSAGNAPPYTPGIYFYWKDKYGKKYCAIIGKSYEL
jgi:hypothetical protein